MRGVGACDPGDGRVGVIERCSSGLGFSYVALGERPRHHEAGGGRFTEEVLQHTLAGESISGVLGMTARQALDFFEAPDLEVPDVGRKLRAMVDVGFDYLTLGQPLSTLSGGECQRLKLVDELHKSGSTYVLDELTTGLHMFDVVAHADWVIDLGPEGGNRGGTVLLEGTPGDLLPAPGSFTGEHLRRALRPESPERGSP